MSAFDRNQNSMRIQPDFQRTSRHKDRPGTRRGTLASRVRSVVGRRYLVANGGADRVRTDDPRLAKPMLSQLSYSPRRMAPLPNGAVGPARFELATPRLSSVCSNQLSYRPDILVQRTIQPVLSKLDRRAIHKPLSARSIIELSGVVRPKPNIPEFL